MAEEGKADKKYARTPLAYLKEQLGFVLNDWKELEDQDKEDLRRWAEEEMEVLGMRA